MALSRKKKKSLFRRINEWLHLWLGLLSGIVVFVVCLTAAIWVLRDEVAYFTKPFNRIEAEERSFAPPSELKYQAKHHLDSIMVDVPTTLRNITYRGKDRTCFIGYLDSVEGVYMGYLHLNPYSGEIVHNELFSEDKTRKFFIFIRAGHRFFWLPRHIGSPLVGSACIIFLITLITGLIWWYPPKWTKSTRKKSFTIKWNARWKRLNIDLHNVLGFYSLLFVFFLTYTGIYYSFEWFRDGYHTVLGITKDELKTELDTSRGRYHNKPMHFSDPYDEIWKRFYTENSNFEGTISLGFSTDSIGPIPVTINPIPDKSYSAFTRHYDKRNLELINAKGFSTRGSNLKFEELNPGGKMLRMNFDIHVGTIGGLSTKILACIASLIGASLPVTGFIIWYNRKWGKKSKRKRIRS